MVSLEAGVPTRGLKWSETGGWSRRAAVADQVCHKAKSAACEIWALAAGGYIVYLHVLRIEDERRQARMLDVRYRRRSRSNVQVERSTDGFVPCLCWVIEESFAILGGLTSHLLPVGSM